MKRFVLMVVAVGVVTYARATFAGEAALKDLVQHFSKNGMTLDWVDYQTVTDDQKNIGVVEGIKVEDDERKRPQITKPLYMFTVLRQKDQESLNAQLQFARARSECYTNGLLLLTFPKSPPLNSASKEKIITLFQSFSAGGSVDDSWVALSTVQTPVSGVFIAADAANLAGGLKIEFRDKKLPWVKSIEGHTGVAILHPLSQQKPAVVTYTPKWLFNRGDILALVCRGSNIEPGVRIVVKFQEEAIADEVVNSKWRELAIPFPKSGGQRTPITIEIWPIGWANEYFYLDSIEVQRGLRQ